MKIKHVFISILSVFICLTAFPQGYNFYYGNIHSHSSYSDGNADNILQTPYEDYNYAKNSLHMDFLGISDHNHMLTKAEFHSGWAEADSANEDGSFVCLYGYEWGYYDAGHVLVYGYDSLMGWANGNYDEFVANDDYTGLFAKIAAKPGAMAFLTHPSSSNFENIANITFNAVSDQAIVGMPVRNGPAFSENTTYSDPSTGNFYSYYDKMLKRGYHLGINLDHDNHNTTFGRTAQSRMVVLAPSLTQANILDAMKNRRFYGSDDWNVKVDFTINSNPMGSIAASNSPPSVSVNVTDPDSADIVKYIEIYYGVTGSGLYPELLVSCQNSASLTYTDSLAAGDMYYYAYIVQADGDEIITSPIWFEKITGINDVADKITRPDIYPNPVKDVLNIGYVQSTKCTGRCRIYDVMGTLYEDITFAGNKFQINVSKLSKGMYFLKIESDETVVADKFIKE